MHEQKLRLIQSYICCLFQKPDHTWGWSVLYTGVFSSLSRSVCPISIFCYYLSFPHVISFLRESVRNSFISPPVAHSCFFFLQSLSSLHPQQPFIHLLSHALLFLPLSPSVPKWNEHSISHGICNSALKCCSCVRHEIKWMIFQRCISRRA